MVNTNVLLFNAQKAYIRIIRNISHGYRGHQPAKKSQCQQQGPIPGICTTNNLYYF